MTDYSRSGLRDVRGQPDLFPIFGHDRVPVQFVSECRGKSFGGVGFAMHDVDLAGWARETAVCPPRSALRSVASSTVMPQMGSIAMSPAPDRADAGHHRQSLPNRCEATSKQKVSAEDCND